MSNFGKDKLVKGLIDKFKLSGLKILYADYDDYKKPEPLREYKPDVIGWNSNKELYYLASAVKPDDITKISDGEKFAELSNLMMRKGNSEGKRIPYFVGTLKTKVEKVEETIEAIGVSKENIKMVGV